VIADTPSSGSISDTLTEPTTRSRRSMADLRASVMSDRS
jgi:hypothetical protein